MNILSIAFFCHFKSKITSDFSLRNFSLIGVAISFGFSPVLYAAKLGPIDVTPVLYLEVEANDNVNTSGENPREDIVLKARLNFTGNWRITENNQLVFNFGLGHQRYLKNENLSSDGLLESFSPNSQFDLDVRVGEFMSLRFSDNLRYEQDPSDLLAVDDQGNLITDVAQYKRLINRFGVQFNWDMNSRTTFLADLSRSDTIPLDDEFKDTQKTNHALYLRLTRRMGPGINVGITGTYSISDFRTGFQNDGVALGYGLFFSWQITPLMSIESSVGYTQNSFEENGNNGDFSDPRGIVASVTFRHAINKDFSYSLKYERAQNNGFISNLVLSDKITFSYAYILSDLFDLTGYFSYEESENSGGLTPETFNRYIAQVQLNYVLGFNSDIFISYRYVQKTSSIDTRTFDQNRIRAGFNYNF